MGRPVVGGGDYLPLFGFIINMFTVGLTGGIGSGKSLVGDLFRALDITVVDADIASREVVVKGSPALANIADHFGGGILLPDGTLDRRQLRECIFANAAEKTWLENLLHPLINNWIREQLNASASPYAVLESPLLLEIDQHKIANRVLVVDVPEQLQLQRASSRDNGNPEQIKAIMATQLPRDERRAQADDIIDNSGSIESTQQQVFQLHGNYLEYARLK